MSEEKTPEEKLFEAIKSGENLPIFRAMRTSVGSRIKDSSLPLDEYGDLMKLLIATSDRITKLEGASDKLSGEDEDIYDSEQELRDAFRKSEEK